MEESEERPLKFRKIDTHPSAVYDVDGEAVPQFAVNPSTSHETYTATTSEDPANKNVAGNADVFEDALTSISGPLSPNHDGSTVSEPSGEAHAMSKGQLKRLRKKQERAESRESWKAARRVKDKEKKARKRAEKAAAEAAAPPAPTDAAAVKKHVHQRPVPVPLTIVMDCDFDALMLEKEINSLSSQITRCYSDIRGGRLRSNFIISSFGGQLKDRFDTVLAKTYLGWKRVTVTEKNFIEAGEMAHSIMYGREGGKVAGALKKPETEGTTSSDIPADDTHIEVSEDQIMANEESKPSEEESASEAAKSAEPTQVKHIPGPDIIKCPTSSQPSIVYLSSDSPNTLTELSPYTTYIIGGLVDKNRHKGICYKRAREAGIPTARLPIGEYMEMQSRTVLATNHVVEIMVRWLELGDWGEAFLKVIPKRKEAKLRVKKENGGSVNVSTGDGEEAQITVETAEEDAASNPKEEAVSSIQSIDKKQSRQFSP